MPRLRGVNIKEPKIKINIGDKFGRLTIICQAENKIQPNGSVKKQYLCLCDCGNIKTIQAQSLRKGVTKSCGCLSKEIASKFHSKTNIYNIDGDNCYGLTTNSNKKFYFDKDDFDIIKRFSWFDYNGYIATNNYKLDGYPKLLKMHRLVMNEKDSSNVVDHINHNKLDNRKENLRIVNHSQNSMNHVLFKNNTSGVSGVCFLRNENKWRATIILNYKTINIGSFDYFEDAVQARKEAEEKYYGEYSYDNSMKFSERSVP